MGRCPLLIVLIIQVAIILITDAAGLHRPQQPPGYGVNDYCAIIETTREASTSGQLLIATVDSAGGEKIAPFKARLHVVSETPELLLGQRIKFSAKLLPLQSPPDIPDIVDLQKNLRRQGVVAMATVPDDSIRYTAPANKLREWFATSNRDLLMRLKRAPLTEETTAVLAATLLGRDEYLGEEVRAGYSAAGMSHVLALSGLHTGIIALIISFALWPFYFGRHVRTRMLITIAALWFYAALTGFIPSVTRSVIMATVYMTGRILQRKSSPVNSLCLAAIAILLFAPDDIYSAGFQLSFAAVAGILLFYPLINKVDRRRHPRLYAFVSYPALSLSAMSLAGPVSAYHFHSFPVYFLIANLVIVPIVAPLIVCGVISMAFEVDFGADILCGAMNRVAEIIAGLPMSTLSNLYPPGWLIILLLTLLIVHAYAANRRHKLLRIETAILFAGVLLCCAVRPRMVYPDKEIYEIAEYRSTQTIVTTADSCFIFTTAKLPSDRKEIEERYRLLLRDFTAKRNLAPPIIK